MNKFIKCAGIVGILLCLIFTLHLIILIFEILSGWLLLKNNFDEVVFSLFDFIFPTSLVLYIIFIYGFKLLAKKYQNTLLKISSYILIIFVIAFLGYFVSTFFTILPLRNKLGDLVMRVVSILAEVVWVGGILFGIALLKLRLQFGPIATAAGVVKIIICGANFCSWGMQAIYGEWWCVLYIPLRILSWCVLFIPFCVLASIILFRAARKIQTPSSIYE